MSIHVCKCEHKGRTEYHLRYPGMYESEAQELADKINSGALAARPAAPGGEPTDEQIERLWHKHCHAIGPIALQDLSFARAVLKLAALSQPSPSVVAEAVGWVKVPKEPTKEMVAAMQEAASGWEAPLYGYECEAIFRAGIAAAPQEGRQP
jgi:hypothetical protein